MSNPLYEQLVGKHDGQTTPFLVLEDGAVVTHTDFLDVGGPIRACVDAGPECPQATGWRHS